MSHKLHHTYELIHNSGEMVELSKQEMKKLDKHGKVSVKRAIVKEMNKKFYVDIISWVVDAKDMKIEDAE